ncbi:hypothetical protein GCM10007854_15890 [Algimonas porphyrae]|uniref:Uncharacterized protein n=1 Tax=Algimonas porphyrae TaxID=1128113 RepID=A0ABQ5V0D9_9PROT|nr:hypothetical protein GCM10007854_15890 [Algimonas porphyrae]
MGVGLADFALVSFGVGLMTGIACRNPPERASLQPRQRGDYTRLPQVDAIIAKAWLGGWDPLTYAAV